MASDALKSTSSFIAACIFFFIMMCVQNSFSQQGHMSSSSFYNINVGFGIPYGGLGLNAEMGKGHFSLHAGFGYALRTKSDTFVIDDSWNWQAGLRYYINVKSDIVYPRVGISYGWVTNYLAQDFPIKEYEQNVYGFSIHLGSQFYTMEGLIVSVDLVGSSHKFLLAPGSHPNFFKVYIRPAVGIGIDIGTIFQKRDKGNKLRNRAIDPFG